MILRPWQDLLQRWASEHQCWASEVGTSIYWPTTCTFPPFENVTVQTHIGEYSYIDLSFWTPVPLAVWEFWGLCPKARMRTVRVSLRGTLHMLLCNDRFQTTSGQDKLIPQSTHMSRIKPDPIGTDCRISTSTSSQQISLFALLI